MRDIQQIKQPDFPQQIIGIKKKGKKKWEEKEEEECCKMKASLGF